MNEQLNEGDSDDDSFACDICVDGRGEGNINLDGESDNLVDEWLKMNVAYNNFRYENTEPFPEGEKYKIVAGIEKFDTLKYFCEEGRVKHPVVTLLARIEFARMYNGGFQERVFSTAGNAQSANQGRMRFDHLEKRSLLAHNKELISEHII